AAQRWRANLAICLLMLGGYRALRFPKRAEMPHVPDFVLMVARLDCWRRQSHVLMCQHCMGRGAMSITTLSSRDFQQNASQPQRAAQRVPVSTTSRGKPVHVLLSIEEYRRITGKRRSIVEALAMPGLADIEVEFPRSRELPRPAEFD